MYAVATSVEDFYGTWTMVKAFIDAPFKDGDKIICPEFKFSPSGTTCTCDGDELISYGVQLNGVQANPQYVFIKDTQEEALNFTRKPCRAECPGNFKVFRKLDNNYFIAYFSANYNEVPDLGLFAKSLPSLEELDTIVSTIEGFEDKIKSTLCPSDGNHRQRS